VPETLTLPNDEAAILARAMNPANWPLTPDVAQAILRLKLADEDKARINELAARARAGELTADEEIEAEEYRQAGCLVELLKSEARQFLAGNGA
jgi:hypothetical protein